MVTVSGNYRARLRAVLLLSVLTAGCAVDMPFERMPPDTAATAAPAGPADVAEVAASRAAPPRPAAGPPAATAAGGQRLVLRSGAVPLPRQDYGAGGEKLPYRPQPNPYTSATAPVPNEARAIFTAASAQLRGDRLDSAREKFEQLAEKYPDLSGPWVRLGEIAERRKQDDQAIVNYRQAISVNSNNVNAYIALAAVQRRLGRFNDAQDSYLAALDVWKDFPEAHLNLAILYDLYGNEPEAAQKHYEAYDFLTGGNNEDVGKWLVEVKNRTGITVSFIDNPPAVSAPAAGNAPAPADVAAESGPDAASVAKK